MSTGNKIVISGLPMMIIVVVVVVKERQTGRSLITRAHKITHLLAVRYPILVR